MSALKPMEAADPKGWRGVVSHIVVYLVALVAALPQITVLVTSFIGTINGSLFTGEFTLDNYRNIFAKSNTSAITNSYLFGLIAIVIVVVCGILISYLSVRKRNALTSVLDVLTMFPYIIPGSVLGISFLYAFNGPPFMLGGTVLIIVISLSIRRMPYTIRSSTAIIGQISPSVEEASISLGASQLKTFLRVTIPMMLPRRSLRRDHELDHAHQRAELLGHSVHQQDHDAHRGDLFRGHPQQLRQCGGLLHDPDSHFDRVASCVFQTQRQKGLERVKREASQVFAGPCGAPEWAHR